jgi:stage III sporulation protein AG
MSRLSSLIAGTRKLWPHSVIKEGVVNTKLILLGVLGAFLLLAGGLFDNSSLKPRSQVPNDAAKEAPAAVIQNRSYEEALEAKMSNVLSQVKGAGAVSVSITLDSSSVREHEKNVVKENKTVQEKDVSGGTRITTEAKETEQVLLSKENGADKPVMVREVKPAIKGVLVIAEGAYDSTVKTNLTKAVETGLGIPMYKITVLPQRK